MGKGYRKYISLMELHNDNVEKQTCRTIPTGVSLMPSLAQKMTIFFMKNVLIVTLLIEIFIWYMTTLTNISWRSLVICLKLH